MRGPGHRKTIILALAFAAAIPLTAAADTASDACTDDMRPVAQMDCLATEIAILELRAKYRDLTSRITDEDSTTTTPPLTPTEQADPVVMEQAQWYIDNIEVYAISGQDDDLVAHVRSNGREYRLVAGDVIQMAKVAAVTRRGIEIAITADTILPIGMSVKSTAQP